MTRDAEVFAASTCKADRTPAACVSMADHGQPPDELLTLTEAATRTGYTREALRQRVRRGTLPATKGNDGVVRVHPRDLADLAPPDESTADHGQYDDVTAAVALDVLVATAADLRADLERTRTALDTAAADRLADHGRAARADAVAAAEARRADVAEARLAAVETALAEARMPWAVRIIRAWRSRDGAGG